jgi:hypothetical protein
MFSLNLWSKLPTPNDSNVTQWWSFLSEEQQLGVAARLRAAERPVIIVQENLYRNTGFMARTYRDGPLARCIEQEFTRLFSIDGYEFRIRLGAGSLPIGIARWNPGPGPGGFAFYQPAAQSGAAARLELIGYEGDAPAPFALEAGGFEIQRSGSLAASGLERWSVALKRLPGANREKFDAVRLTGADGRIVAAARFERPEPQLNPN